MRLRTSALALVMLAGLGLGLQAAAPLDLWPRQVPPLDKNALKERLGVLDSEVGNLPASLNSAAEFQKLFLRIISGEAAAVWRDGIEKFANASEQSPLEAGLREISRAWLARLEMADIDTALRGYYRQNVRFPATLSEVEADIPGAVRKDPWGGVWFYQPHPPQGFQRLVTQRYQLGPARFPKLGNLKDATQHRDPVAQSWKITLREIAGNKALEFRGSAANASVAILQPGGRVDDCTLLFIGDGWALMAGVDQLFAVTF